MPTVKCILRKSKSNPEQGTLQIRLYQNGRNTEISLKQKIQVDQWNIKKRVVKSNHPNSMQLNILIKRKMAEYEAKFADAFIKEKSLSLEEVVDPKAERDLTKLRQMLLVDYVNQNIEENHYRFNTKKNYTNLIHNLKKHYPKIRLGEVNEKWIKKFYKRLLDQKLSINYIEDHMKVLRKLTRLAFKEGVLDCFPFEDIKSKKQEGKREYLTEEELVRLINVETHSNKEEFVKDAFVFSCLTGVRFSDLCLIQKSDIKLIGATTSKSYKLSFRMKKTQETIGLKLPTKALELTRKYNDTDSLFVFPILKDSMADVGINELDRVIASKNSNFNNTLKSIINRANITKRISMHCGRNTMATLGLDKGIPIQVMQKLLGHKNIKETQIYAKVLGKQLDEAMEKFDGIL